MTTLITILVTILALIIAALIFIATHFVQILLAYLTICGLGLLLFPPKHGNHHYH